MRSIPPAAAGSKRPIVTVSTRSATVTVTGTLATVTVSFSVIAQSFLPAFVREVPVARGGTGAGCRERAGAVLVGPDLVQDAADQVPADAADGERDFADD